MRGVHQTKMGLSMFHGKKTSSVRGNVVEGGLFNGKYNSGFLD